MPKTLSFKGRKKPYLVIEMEDGEKLLVKPPLKSMMDNLVEMSRIGDTSDLAVLDSLYASAAELLSWNMSGKKYTKKDLEQMFDIDDIFILFKTYIDFVTGLQTQKN